MKRIFIKGLGIAAFSLALVSCSGPKQVTEQEVAMAAVNTPTTELVDQKQMEFEYLFVEALKQKMFGNAQKAIQLLSSCLEIDPNSSSAMYELANIHAANNDLMSASLLLEKAISIDDDNKWYKQLLAQIYQQSRKFSEAADLYTRLLEDDPENIEFLYSKAVLLSNAKKYDEAIATYNELENKTGINEQITVAKQQLYVTAGEIDKAFEEVERLIELTIAELKSVDNLGEKSVIEIIEAIKELGLSFKAE